MHSSPSAPWLSEIVVPLAAKFGDNLILKRAGNAVCWVYDGQCAVIELESNSLVRATFIDSEQLDLVTAKPVAAAYRARRMYALDSLGCRTMAADLADFFSGVREPKFTFIDMYPR